MLNIIRNYAKILEGLPAEVFNSDYKVNYYAKVLDISKATMYRKLKRISFSPKEVEKIVTILYPEEALFAALEQSEDELKNGKIKPHEQVMRESREKFF